MSSTLRRWLLISIIVVAAIAAGSQLRASLGIDLSVASVRSFAEGLGPLGPLLFVGVVALRAFLALPSQVVLIAAGLCFGTVLGTLVGGVGLMLSGLAMFFGTRFAARREVEQRAGSRFGSVLEASGRRGGAIAIAISSGYPISPLSPIHAAAGLTPMSVGLFALAALSGGLIRASVFAFFGSALTKSDSPALLYATLALAIALALPLAFPQGRAWLRSLFVPGAARTVTLDGSETPVNGPD